MQTPPPQSYDPQALEAHWQGVWAHTQAFATRNQGTPCYILEMLPYPSGALHMGHVRNYAIGDAFARYRRMRGEDVLHPMGWDALGLPAENQAIREQVAPQVRTPKNIAQMRAQMLRLGLGYDWSRELATYQPDYYRWNQWFFLQMLARDWVYRRQAQVNWCPGCQTVLANEQVRDDNTCWRGHAGVTQRKIAEWAFRITAFAEALLADLDGLSGWPERIVNQQRHWIGKSTGAELHFALAAQPERRVDVFTTRIDTLMGCTYLVLAPEHPLVADIVAPEQAGAVEAFLARMRQSDRIARTAASAPKEGVATGAFALHPLTGARLPIWLANFVLADYGTGAVMAVPAHDARDHAFALQAGLPMRQVVAPAPGAAPAAAGEAFTQDGVLIDSGAYTGLDSATARQRLTEAAAAGGFGRATTSWHLRDWGFSRQRYWGTPIPIVYCDACGTVPVPEAELPVRLPDFDASTVTGAGGAPLGKLEAFWRCACPRCGEPARREVDTMDTFVDSAWYFARYLSPKLTSAPFDAEAARRWLPIDVYVGGPEHAVMHLLYFRFWTKAMQKMGLVDVHEPVRRLITQGMVNAPAYHCPQHGYQPAPAAGAAAQCATCAAPLRVQVEKMSKSKYNGIDPMALIERYGADAARLYTLFAAPPEKDLEWNTDGVEGIARFLARVWRLMQAQAPRTQGAAVPTGMAGLSGADAEVRRAVHQCIARIGDEMAGRNHFNTAIAQLMELSNVLHAHQLHADGAVAPGVAREALLAMAQLLAPFAPHLAEALWAAFGGQGLVCHSAWPEADPAALTQASLQLAVQINGKLRGQVQVPSDASEAQAFAAAAADAGVSRHLAGKQVIKRIYVPGRLVNLVVRDA